RAHDALHRHAGHPRGTSCEGPVDPVNLADSNAPAPAARLLSNGRDPVVISAAGGGQSRCNGLALNRWSGDRVEDDQGYFFYLRDLATGRFWSSGLQPVRDPGAICRAEYRPARVSLVCDHERIEARVDVTVSPGDDLEIRRIRVRNRSATTRRLEVTSYLEVVLNHPAAHATHPAFSKLFVQTERVPDRAGLLARRRPRANEEYWPRIGRRRWACWNTISVSRRSSAPLPPRRPPNARCGRGWRCPRSTQIGSRCSRERSRMRIRGSAHRRSAPRRTSTRMPPWVDT